MRIGNLYNFDYGTSMKVVITRMKMVIFSPYDSSFSGMYNYTSQPENTTIYNPNNINQIEP